MNKVLVYVSVLASLLYFVIEPWHPFPCSIVLKGLSVAPLAIFAWRNLPDRDGLLLSLALALSSLGDVLLDVSPKLFAAGLGSFLLAHLLFITLFRRNHPRPLHWTNANRIAVALLIAIAIGFVLWLAPVLGPLTPAVIAYICAITTMVICAVLLDLPQKWVAIGALLFFISDAILATSKFKMPVPGRSWLVWSTYYLAQCGITFGFLQWKANMASARRGKLSDLPSGH